MKKFMGENFLLNTDTAKTLYHDYAAKMPIIDYHCHISPQEIYEDLRFENITRAWLGGDHYKWRLIRACGLSEKFVTGDASDKEKFLKFAECLPRAIGSPVYHWCHLELRTYFEFDKPLSPDTAEECWEHCNKMLNKPEFSVRGLIKQSNVVFIGTTDDPADSLQWHEKIAQDASIKVKVVPSYRPDKAINIDKAGFVEYMGKLSLAADMQITDFSSLKAAISKTLEKFVKLGCKASDHGLEAVPFAPTSEEQVAAIFQRALSGQVISGQQADEYKTAVLMYLAQEYHKHDIAMQLHYSALRNNNTKMFAQLGADTGYDAIATVSCVANIVAFLNALEMSGQLPKTILYSLNGVDNEVLAVIAGCFQGEGVRSKIQHGSAWWFNDTKLGMIAQLTTLADVGVLGNFIGMLTDSRSFLSYPRHAYFRRILCELLGSWVENGEYPADIKRLGDLVQAISYNNAREYFNLKI